MQGEVKRIKKVHKIIYFRFIKTVNVDFRKSPNCLTANWSCQIGGVNALV